MKEHPIIFSTSLVPKVLDGTKTLTRRTWGLEFINKSPNTWVYDWDSLTRQHRFYDKYYTDNPPIIVKCPYGEVGDGLWMKETFWIQHDSEWNEYSGKSIDCGINIAEDDWAEVWYCATDQEPSEADFPPSVYSKRPSIFMPRWASRKDLVITTLRAERVQEITQEDAIREGIARLSNNAPLQASEVVAFANLWDSLNAKRGYSWEMNPWVWVIGLGG